jgi:NAD(P)-dependent dehydrogenase (short-subunit alcohol dehydrogenase family)
MITLKGEAGIVMNRFENRSILVIGGSSGIGLQLSRDIRSEGAEVFVWSRHEHEDFKSLQIRHQPVDVSMPFNASTLTLPDTLHGLVYCPGTIRLAPIQRLTEEDFQQDFNINVLGAVRAIKACLPVLTKAGRNEGASVVLFSTVASHLGMHFHASIAAAKSAVQGLARSLAAELSTKGIRINVVSPSLTDTPLAASLIDSDEKRNRSDKRHPLGRIGTPSDISSAAAFLLSDESSWITGQALPVDGGMSSIRML